MSREYTIRPYEPEDRWEFLALFDRVLGGTVGPAWFAWKYEANPYTYDVPIIVAEHENEVVGARAFFGLRLAIDDTEYAALQPCDTMVAADHRRKGLFTRMTETAIDRYRGDYDLFFNFPNHRSLPGNLELGWREVGTPETYYRVQNPAALDDRLGGLSRVVAGGYLRLRDRFTENHDVGVTWHDGVPADRLASLAGEPMSRLHVRRDERFYDWRFENPHWTYRTVVATRGDETAAAVVGHRTQADGTTTAMLADVLPLTATTAESPVRAGLLHAVCRSYADADLLVASGESFAEETLSTAGFHGDGRAPLSWVASQTNHVVRPLDEDLADWTAEGRRLTSPDSWRLARCEHDTG